MGLVKKLSLLKRYAVPTVYTDKTSDVARSTSVTRMRGYIESSELWFHLFFVCINFIRNVYLDPVIGASKFPRLL